MARKVAKKARAKARKGPDLQPLQVHLYGVDGKIVGTVDLPPVFASGLRTDLIRRAVDASRANRRQPHAPKPGAGMRHSVEWSGKGRGISRTPRIRGTQIGAEAPYTRKGRAAFPPRVERDWSKKINRKERRMARNAALAATHDPALVSARGHRFDEGTSLPVVVHDDLEKIHTTKEALAFLHAVGVSADTERTRKGRHVRAGRGKMRGRKYRTPRGALLIVRDTSRARLGFGNVPGLDVLAPESVDTEALAPGGDPGRLVILSAGALEAIRGWGA